MLSPARHCPQYGSMAIANETLRAGEAALREKDFRRLGLAISVFFIAITVAAIWFLIRRLEAREILIPDTNLPKVNPP